MTLAAPHRLPLAQHRRIPIPCSCGCALPAGYLVYDRGEWHVEMTYRHHGQHHTTTASIGRLIALITDTAR